MGRTRQRRPGHQQHLSIALVLALAVLVLLAATGPAAAGPPGPTLDLAALQAKLASGPLDGYMITTMQGSTPEQIPVSVLAVVEASTWGKLIMFESTDPAIADIGGIAAGMSGSPVYVDDSGTDKLVGAVSYGSDFSLRGTGLATPIEYMTRAQDAHRSVKPAPVRAAVTLGRPVRTATGVVKTLVLAANQKAARATTATAGQAVMHPLALAEIGGLPTTSTAYKKLAARLEKNGLTVVAAPAGGKTPALTPDLEAGSPCGVLFSNGFYWMGVLGTVTYLDGDTAMLFGHPILGDFSGWGLGAGPMQGTLTGAIVDGVWPSSWSPFKMMTPADAKGTAVEDRSAGVVAELGGSAPEYPVTTRVTVNDAADSVVDVTNVSEWFGTQYAPGLVDELGLEDPGATGYVVSAGLYHALDSDMMAGSGTTTTTVEVSDATGPYTVSRVNIWDTDGGYGLGDLAASDAADLVSSLVNDPYGLRTVHIDSVDVTASLSSARLSAGLADVRLQRALRPGDNDVAVDYYRYGSPVLQTLHATLPIPAGTQLNGYVEVMSAAAAGQSGYFDSQSDSSPVDPPETLAQVAARLEAASTNGDLIVAYTPSGFDGGGYGTPAAALSTTPTDRVFSGDLSKKTRIMELRALHRTIDLGAPVVVRGMVEEAKGDVKVGIYSRPSGMPDPTVPTKTVTANEEGGSATFVCLLSPASHNEQITAEAPALDEDGLPGAAMVTVKVKAKVSLAVGRSGGHWHCTATVKPKDAGGSVKFQRRAGGRWVALATVAVGAGGKARTSVAAKAAPRVRVRFAGNDRNAASTWAVSR